MYAELKMVLSRPIVPMLICAALSILIVWQLSMGVYSFFSSSNAGDGQTMLVVEKKIKKQGDSNPGLRAPIFGEYVPVDLKDSNIKQSMLNLEIVGIIFAENEENSHVIIRTASGKEQTFHVGDTLPGGVIIKRITPEGVLVGHNGAIESLSLPKNELTFEPVAKPLIEE